VSEGGRAGGREGGREVGREGGREKQRGSGGLSRNKGGMHSLEPRAPQKSLRKESY